MTRSRAAAVFGICAISGAIAIWLNHGAPFPLTDAAACPGALELAASMAASARPAVPIASTLVASHQVAMFMAAMLSTFAVWRFTQSAIGSATIGIVVAASPLLLPALAPTSVAALAVAAAVWCAGVAGGNIVAVLIGLTCASAIAPSLGLPIAILCGILARRRGGPWLALAASAACLVVTAGVMLATPPLLGQTPAGDAIRCMVPSHANVGALTTAIDSVFSGVGPLALILGAFGLFAVVSERTRAGGRAGWSGNRVTLALGWPVAACLSVLFVPSDPLRTLAPVVTGFWLLVGRGVVETVNWGGTDRRRRIVAGLVPLVFVAISVQTKLGTSSETPETPAQLGHDQLTRRNFRALLSELPPGSGLVDEDAVTSILLRSLSDSLRRARIALQIVPASATAADAAHRTQRVFALPRAQRRLQTNGVRFVEGLMPAVPGIAEIAEVLPCDIAVDSWHTATSTHGATTLALVSDSEAARGPLALWLGGPSPIDVSPVAWTRLSLRGFYTHRYNQHDPEARQALAREVAADDAPRQHGAVTAVQVTRAELWRVPGAAHALVIQLSSPPEAALIKQLPQATGTVRLCRAFLFELRAMAPHAEH